jgi:transposase
MRGVRAWAALLGLHETLVERGEFDERPDELGASVRPRGSQRWISWARRGRLPQFVKLARSITRDRDAIIAAIINTLSNALIESTNTTIRLIIRRAFGFHSAHAIIALARLTLGGHPPEPPGR